jgi:biopolymer transport protein ExbB
MMATVMAFMATGGVMMWPLMGLAVVALYALIYKGIGIGRLYWRYRRVDGVAVVSIMVATRGDGGVRLQDGPVEALVERGMGDMMNGESDAAITDQLTVMYDDAMYRLESGLSIVAVVAEVMPMVGLLGTVSGMIHVFQAIAMNGVAETVSVGISEALLTTKVGLMLAIPTMIGHTLLSVQIDAIANHMRRAVAAVIAARGRIESM